MTKPISLKDWQDMFEEIYGARNAHIDISKMWLKVVAESSKIARLIRKEDHKQLREAIPDFFAWFFSFANLYNTNLEDAIWDKFPGVCPYCEKAELCNCLANVHSVYNKSNLADIRKRTRRNKPTALVEWISMFNRIYGNINRIVDQDKIGFHFLEEVGEVAEELSKKNQNRGMCKDEIADVFAWLVALTERVNKLFDSYSIEDGIYTMYPGSCKSCGGNPCSCPDEDDRK